MSGTLLNSPGPFGTPVGWESSTTDPRAAGLDRPIGSIVFNPSTLAVYRKTSNVATTDWARQNTFKKVTSGAATTVTVASGLNGESDFAYTIIGRVVNATASNCRLYLRPNGLTTNAYHEVSIAIANGSTAAASGTTDLAIAAAIASQTTMFYCNIFARHNGAQRFLVSNGVRSNGAAAPDAFLYSAIWDETTTEITSFVIESEIASAISSGSEFMVMPWR